MARMTARFASVRNSIKDKNTAPNRLIILGGTLINPNDQPMKNAMIIVEGDRIQSITQHGAAPIPKNARVIDAKGKTILPGLIDGHGHYEDFAGEIYLNLGVTTCPDIEIFRDDYWSLAQKQGIRLGKIRGPRLWTAGRGLGPRHPSWSMPGGRAFRGTLPFSTVEEARALVRRKKQIGHDIIKLNELLTPELLKAAVEEAHGLGMPVVAHSLDIWSYAPAGVDGVEHHWSVALSSIADSEKRQKLALDRMFGRVDTEEIPYYAESENFDRLIDLMVKNRVSWTPTIATWLRPLSPSARQFIARERSILNNPRAKYLPPVVRAYSFGQYEKFAKWPAEKLERVKRGYEKLADFMRRFVRAGGTIRAGSDPSNGMPAMGVHQELKMFVEAGLSPAQAISTATINVAKTYFQDKAFGSIAPGKVADIIVVDGNPLNDIWATQKVKTVVIGGKMIDTDFHPSYANPIPSPDPWKFVPREIEVSPASIPQGKANAKIKVHAQRLQPYHRVVLNGTQLDTRYVGKTELEAKVPVSMIKNAGVYDVSVVSPGEFNARSSSTHLIVTFRQ
jgi:imidazolonepropionase-like amidohydrolase